MRRALATIGLTIAALTFILRFNPQQGVTFAAGSVAPSTSPPAPADPSETTTSTTSASSTTAAPSTTQTTAAPTTTTTTLPPTTTVADQTVAGDVINTEWGPVQVAATVSGSELIDVEVLQIPDHARRSRQINDYVTPIYRDAALEAQSADFWGVSGATVTWIGYVRSLQAALDIAGI